MKPILHILSNPYGTVNTNNRIDPFSMLTWKFIHHMTARGWPCIHYSTPGSQVDCMQVPCLDEIVPDQETNVIRYNERAAHEIALRKQPGDMILCFYGAGNGQAALAHPDCKIIEPVVCYNTKAVFAEFRVFGSYAHMHMFYGERGMLMNPSSFDAMIPNAITASEFDFSEHKDDYFLYFGRVIEHKGVQVAIQATEAAGKKLIIAGPGTLQSMGYLETPSHVTMMGLCDADQRRQLMSGARAILGPTIYVEPFGNMVAEGYMSGTPAITTDWGGFTDTVVQGVTGFRCREFREFVQAIDQIDRIDPHACRKWALDNYEDSVVHDKFDAYLEKIITKDFYRS
jgi:glycosyltransferase involved in cell wall biosynthesis